MKSILIAAALAAGPAFATTELVAGFGMDEVRIYEQKCEIASVLRHIPEDKRKDFRKARARVNGRAYFACYVVVGPDRVLIVYEDGDIGMIPVEAFKEPKNI